jgi:uncharacterized protein (DUF58 family)
MGIRHAAAHQSGEALSRVAWKQLAQGRGLLVKQFCEPGQDDTHLSLQRVGAGSGAAEGARLVV